MQRAMTLATLSGCVADGLTLLMVCTPLFGAFEEPAGRSTALFNTGARKTHNSRILLMANWTLDLI